MNLMWVQVVWIEPSGTIPCQANTILWQQDENFSSLCWASGWRNSLGWLPSGSVFWAPGFFLYAQRQVRVEVENTDSGARLLVFESCHLLVVTSAVLSMKWGGYSTHPMRFLGGWTEVVCKELRALPGMYQEPCKSQLWLRYVRPYSISVLRQKRSSIGNAIWFNLILATPCCPSLLKAISWVRVAGGICWLHGHVGVLLPYPVTSMGKIKVSVIFTWLSYKASKEVVTMPCPAPSHMQGGAEGEEAS